MQMFIVAHHFDHIPGEPVDIDPPAGYPIGLGRVKEGLEGLIVEFMLLHPIFGEIDNGYAALSMQAFVLLLGLIARVYTRLSTGLLPL